MCLCVLQSIRRSNSFTYHHHHNQHSRLKQQDDLKGKDQQIHNLKLVNIITIRNYYFKILKNMKTKEVAKQVQMKHKKLLMQSTYETNKEA